MPANHTCKRIFKGAKMNPIIMLSIIIGIIFIFNYLQIKRLNKEMHMLENVVFQLVNLLIKKAKEDKKED